MHQCPEENYELNKKGVHVTSLKKIKHTWKEFSELSMKEVPQVAGTTEKKPKTIVVLENMSIHISLWEFCPKPNSRIERIQKNRWETILYLFSVMKYMSFILQEGRWNTYAEPLPAHPPLKQPKIRCDHFPHLSFSPLDFNTQFKFRKLQ